MNNNLNNQTMTNQIKSNRFVIRKSLIGKNQLIEFTDKKGVTTVYNHDVVYNALKDKFEAMECFAKYKSYTASNAMPKFVRDLPALVDVDVVDEVVADE
jgi:hypothetical protein